VGRALSDIRGRRVLLVSSDDKELSRSELMDEREPAKHHDGPSCSPVADKSLNDFEAAKRQ